jgi:pyruvate formate lyase activating enzyme
MRCARGLIFDIKHFSLHDGPGIRTTIFFKGCPLKCKWCHSPESQSYDKEIIFNEQLCIGCGSCVATCPTGAHLTPGRINHSLCRLCLKCVEECYSGALEAVGYVATVESVLVEIEKDNLLYETSNGGVTISGGEPVSQPEFLMQLLKALKVKLIHTALDTCGYTNWGVMKKIAPMVDLFLYDLKHMDPQTHTRLTGHSNRQILSNLKKLDELGASLRIRVPLIPGINDSIDNMRRMTKFLRGLNNLEGVDLLPYHKIGVPKYSALGRDYLLNYLKVYEIQQLVEIRSIFENQGLPATLVGVD